VFLLPLSHNNTTLINLWQSKMQEQKVMTTLMYLENILRFILQCWKLLRLHTADSTVNEESLGGTELEGHTFKAVSHKSIQHNHTYFYLIKITCFRNRWQDEVREDGRIVGGERWQEKVHNREERRKLLRRARNRHILHMPME
jgi:hypothetical protein